jgi:hypothetical protein
MSNWPWLPNAAVTKIMLSPQVVMRADGSPWPSATLANIDPKTH